MLKRAEQLMDKTRYTGPNAEALKALDHCTLDEYIKTLEERLDNISYQLDKVMDDIEIMIEEKLRNAEDDITGTLDDNSISAFSVIDVFDDTISIVQSDIHARLRALQDSL